MFIHDRRVKINSTYGSWQLRLASQDFMDNEALNACMRDVSLID